MRLFPIADYLHKALSLTMFELKFRIFSYHIQFLLEYIQILLCQYCSTCCCLQAFGETTERLWSNESRLRIFLCHTISTLPRITVCLWARAQKVTRLSEVSFDFKAHAIRALNFICLCDKMYVSVLV